MECPKCRHRIYSGLSPEDLIFCPYCGERMTPPEVEEFKYCPACAQELPPGSIYCLSCGKRVKMEEPSPPISFQPLGSSETNAEPLKEKPSRPPLAASREDIAELVNPEATETDNQLHSPSREDISKLVNEEVPEPFAEAPPESMAAKARPRPTGKPLWPKIKARIGKMIEPLRDFVSGHWRLRRLYHKWANDGVFAPDEIPTTETLNQITREAGGQPQQPTRLVLIIVASVVFVAFFVLIGIVMSRG